VRGQPCADSIASIVVTEQEARDFVLTTCPPLPERQEKPQRRLPAYRFTLEKQLTDILPPELLEWLPRATKAIPDERGSIESFNDYGAIVSYFSTGGLAARISSPDIAESIVKHMEGWLERRWLPIASDGCGDYFLLIEHSPGRRIVVFWDQSNDYDEYDYVYASNLWHFLAGALSKPRGKWPFKEKSTLAFDPGMGDLKGVRFGWSDSDK
jgi:hypothetical protein